MNNRRKSVSKDKNQKVDTDDNRGEKKVAGIRYN